MSFVAIPLRVGRIGSELSKHCHQSQVDFTYAMASGVRFEAVSSSVVKRGNVQEFSDGKNSVNK